MILCIVSKVCGAKLYLVYARVIKILAGIFIRGSKCLESIV